MAGMDKVHQPTGKRERINPTGAEGGSRYLRRDTHGRPISEPTASAMPSTPRQGMKDRGD